MKKIGLIICCIGLLFSESCKDDNQLTGDCFVPDVSVNLTVNMDLPEYFHLQTLGGSIELDAGNRGVFLIHNYDDAFYAIERTCTYQSENECAKLHVNETTLQLRCGTPADTGFVNCCNSTFLFDSRVVSGPAVCNLKTYRLSKNGNTLYISN